MVSVLFAAATIAIAPVPVGQKAPPELQRVFSEELQVALAEAGFAVKEPKEVDLQVAERPELLHCVAGGCLGEEAAYLNVGQLVLPRLDPISGPHGTDGSLVVGLVLWGASEKRPVAEAVERCGGDGSGACGAEKLKAVTHALARKLREDLSRPGTLVVRTVPRAQLAVDGKALGSTPFRGELPPGDHLLVLEVGGARVERDVAVAPGRVAQIDVTLEPERPKEPGELRTSPRRHLRAIGWAALGVGLAAAAVGAGLWSLDGRGTCTLSGVQRECPKVWDTLPAGASLVGVGGALVVSSIIMVAVGGRF
jgi:hypothetical protein